MAVNNGVSEISEKEFNAKINSKLVVVDFYAEWCMPCVMMQPVIEELAERFKNKISFAKVNVDDNQSLSNKFKIVSIPTLVIFKQGKEIGRITGSLAADILEEKLKKLL